MLLALLGPRTEQIPFDAGRLCLGQWQRVLLFCLDGDTRAEYTLTLLGLSHQSSYSPARPAYTIERWNGRAVISASARSSLSGCWRSSPSSPAAA